jgi:hypothetical protein
MYTAFVVDSFTHAAYSRRELVPKTSSRYTSSLKAAIVLPFSFSRSSSSYFCSRPAILANSVKRSLVTRSHSFWTTGSRSLSVAVMISCASFPPS